jgi:GMP synthase (glutamine-hydrolysing)
LRKEEFSKVLHSYKHMGLNVKGVDARDRFLDALKGVSDPETKRKIIGRCFIEVFDQEARKLKDVKWLAQGTIYPDVIESVSVNGPSATIKSHHNVGGLPEKMNLKVVEPLKLLFKDEVRRVGTTLGIDKSLLEPSSVPRSRTRHQGSGRSYQGKGMALLQEVDDIFIKALWIPDFMTRYGRLLQFCCRYSR